MSGGEEDGQDDDGSGPVPEPTPIEIDNRGSVTIAHADDTVSPYASLNGTSLEARDKIAVARLEGIAVADGRIPARTGLQLAEALAHALDTLGGRSDLTLLDDVDLAHGLQLLLASEVDDQTSIAAASAGGIAVERLQALVRASSYETLIALLRAYDDEILKVLEALMGLLATSRASLDVQQRLDERPARLTSERAGAYLAVLRRQQEDEDRPATLIGHLDGIEAPAGTDRRDFRMTLHQRWRRKSVIRGTFDVELTDLMGDLVLQDVVILAEVSRRQRGERKTKLSFHATNVRPLDDRNLRLATETEVA